jgi:subtilase family serine protease
MGGDKGTLLVGLAAAGAGAYLLLRGKPGKAAALEVTSVSVDPSTVSVGQTVTITVKVRNLGGTPGSGRVRVTADGTPLGEFDTGTIVPGGEATATAQWTTGKTGTYQVCASLV